MNKKLKICLIGCGRAGMIHARNYAGNVRGAELIAFCDPSAECLDAATAEIEVPYVYKDYTEALKNPEIDAVIVVTPTRFHHDVVIAAAIGDVAMIKSNTYGPSEPREWMYDVSKSYGPVGEVNSHDFDTVRWYAGSEVKLIHAIGHNFRSPEKAEEYPEYYDTCSVLLQFENGVIATITGAQYVRYGYDSRAEVLGTKGIVKVGSQETNTVELVTADQTIQRDSMDSWRTLFRDAYLAEAQAFVNCVLNDTEPEVTGYDGKMALILVNEGLRSILEKRPIEITR